MQEFVFKSNYVNLLPHEVQKNHSQKKKKKERNRYKFKVQFDLMEWG